MWCALSDAARSRLRDMADELGGGFPKHVRSRSTPESGWASVLSEMRDITDEIDAILADELDYTDYCRRSNTLTTAPTSPPATGPAPSAMTPRKRELDPDSIPTVEDAE